MAPEPDLPPASLRDRLYDEAIAHFGPALARIARTTERDAHKQEDLLQEIHFALWQSFVGFDHRCSVGTWVYRVAHNMAASHALKDRRAASRQFVSLDDLAAAEQPRHAEDLEETTSRRLLLDEIAAIAQRLHPVDRQVLLLYLEGLEGAEIGEVTGLSVSNVGTKVHRIKKILKQRIVGGAHGGR